MQQFLECLVFNDNEPHERIRAAAGTRMYDENLTYDKNGNIMTLKRNGDNDAQVGALAIDNLAYTYKTNSNGLLNVADGTNSTPRCRTNPFVWCMINKQKLVVYQNQ